MGWFDSAGAADTTTPSMIPDVGPQTDGTVMPSPTAIIPVPTDTAGGAPADYAASVLDIFKTGIGAWSAANQQQQLFDYKKWEATNGGLYRQGQPATLSNASNGGTSTLVMMGIAAIVVFAVLTHKG